MIEKTICAYLWNVNPLESLSETWLWCDTFISGILNMQDSGNVYTHTHWRSLHYLISGEIKLLMMMWSQFNTSSFHVYLSIYLIQYSTFYVCMYLNKHSRSTSIRQDSNHNVQQWKVNKSSLLEWKEDAQKLALTLKPNVQQHKENTNRSFENNFFFFVRIPVVDVLRWCE